MLRKRPYLHAAAIGSLQCLSILSAVQHLIVGYLVMPVLLLLFIRLMPICRKRENLWMFFLVAVCSVPINLSLIFRYVLIGRTVLRLIIRPTAFFLLLSVEEVIMGYITRTIWVRQYKLPYYDQET